MTTHLGLLRFYLSLEVFGDLALGFVVVVVVVVMKMMVMMVVIMMMKAVIERSVDIGVTIGTSSFSNVS